MSFKNSCFPAAKPLPGQKRSFPDVKGRVVPSLVRKRFLSPEADSLNLSSPALQPSESEIAKNGSSSISCTKLQPVPLTTPSTSSKIPVRIQTFSDKTKAPPKDVAQFVRRSEKTSKIPVWVKALDCTVPGLLEIRKCPASKIPERKRMTDASIMQQLTALNHESNKLPLFVNEDDNQVCGDDLPSSEPDGANLISFRKKWFLEPPTITKGLVDLPNWATHKGGTKFVNEIPIPELLNAQSTYTSNIIAQPSRKKWFLKAPVVKHQVELPNWAKAKMNFPLKKSSGVWH